MDSAPFTPCYLSEMQTIYTLYCTLIKRCFLKPYSNGSFIIMKINLKNHYKLYYAKRQNIDVTDVTVVFLMLNTCSDIITPNDVG